MATPRPGRYLRVVVRPGLIVFVILLTAPARAEAPDASVPAEATRPRRELKSLKLLYFHATWCGSCKKLDASGVMDRAKAKWPDLVVEKVDVDTDKERLERYGVEATPTLVLVDADGFQLARPKVTLDDAAATLARIEKAVVKATK